MRQKMIGLFMTAALVGCSVDSQSPVADSETGDSSGKAKVQGAILSDDAQDPYTPENMTKAVNQLILEKSGGKSGGSEVKLSANYLYVRFLPKGKDGLAALKTYDPELVLFDHPLDYKRVPKNFRYVDPSLPSDVIPVFATVPVDYTFGETAYEIVKGLLLIEPLNGEDSDSRSVLAKTSAGADVALTDVLDQYGLSLQQVELASLMLTGNLEERMGHDVASLQKVMPNTLAALVAWSLPGSTWKPKGTLKFQEDNNGVITARPLEGVRVIGGYSYYWREAHTNENGYFEIPERWSYSIDYEANFDAAQFLLESGWSVVGEDLEIEWNDHKSSWNATFTGNQAKWCVIWTAAYSYFYKDIGGLTRPRQNTWWNLSLDIQVYDNKDASSKGAAVYWNGGVFEFIDVNTVNRQAPELYANTMHELAHSAHYYWMKTNNALLPQSAEFALLPTRLKETYAAGMDWHYKRLRYGGNRVYSYHKAYTGLFEDLIDNNTWTCPVSGKAAIAETVQGFTIQQLEQEVYRSTTWNGFRDRLKNTAIGSTQKTAIDNLFAFWGSIPE